MSIIDSAEFGVEVAPQRSDVRPSGKIAVAETCSPHAQPPLVRTPATYEPTLRSDAENLAEIQAHDEVAVAMATGEMEMYIDELGAPVHTALRAERAYELDQLRRTIGDTAFNALKI